MADISLDEIRLLARNAAHDFIAPIVEADEETETFRKEVIGKLGALGLTGIATPTEYGGAGLGTLEYVTALEEIAAISASYAISLAVSGLPQMILNTYGTETQKLKYIAPLASGQAVGAFSLSEASSGSDAASLKTRAEKKGSTYILNGTKLWTTQADSADVMLMMARTEGANGASGVSAFIIEKDTPGVTFGKRERKMGLNISHTMEVILENVQVPAAQLVLEEGAGMKIALSALDSGRITIASTGVGVARAAFEVAANHANEREQFGRPILDFQGVGFLLADMLTNIDASRLLVERAATLKDANKPYSIQAAQAKLFATDTAMQVTTDAVQILGGSGYTREFPTERYMREAKVLQIVEGTNQIQRLVIARSLKRK
jgi:butyryl-CoA dehydrogenase